MLAEYSEVVSRTTQIHAALTQIAERVVGVAPGNVVAHARLREDLGIDSLSILEICDALASQFDTYLPDGVVDQVSTVGELIHAVDQQGTKPPPTDVRRPAPKSDSSLVSDLVAEGSTAQPSAGQPTQFAQFAQSAGGYIRGGDETIHVADVAVAKTKAKRWAAGMALIGAVIGLVIGIGVIGLVRASGLNDVAAPPAAPTTEAAETDASPSASPSASSSPSATKKKKKASLKTESEQVAPGEEIRLSGALPELDRGVSLQVQTKEGSQDWDDFPVTTVTNDDGKFTTIIRTERPGKRGVRLIDKGSGKKTPPVDVTIGG